MSKELTREQVDALLITGDDIPYGNAHRLVLAHDAAQRATIQQLELEVTSYKKVIASNQKEFRKAEEIIQQLEARVKELTVVAGRVSKLEEHIREVCAIELNVLSNMGISFVEKAVRWYQQQAKQLEARVKELAASAPPCRWSQDDAGSDAWRTACGGLFSITNGTPQENKMSWCCYCGGKLEEPLDTAPDSA